MKAILVIGGTVGIVCPDARSSPVGFYSPSPSVHPAASWYLVQKLFPTALCLHVTVESSIDARLRYRLTNKMTDRLAELHFVTITLGW